MTLTDPGPRAFVRRLTRATNEHDLDALVDCFAVDYVNETPAHPARSFRGREQVRRNWEQIFAAVPDLSAVVVRDAVDGSSVWMEWLMTGTRRDGAAHVMAGVTVFGVVAGRAASARFYLEPVDVACDGIDAAVARVVGTAG